jgi:hypothetical protein
MAQIIQETDTYRLYSDGTEEVFFSEAEWGAMLSDPVYFGYSCRAGHRIREDDPFVMAEGCPKCFAGNEYGEVIPPDFPLVRCGHCGDHHVGVGAVRRCSIEGRR